VPHLYIYILPIFSP